MLAKVKTALRITTTAFDTEITDLIKAAILDLEIIGARIGDPDLYMQISDPLVIRAIVTFCKCNFGEPENYAQLKASYDEQKAQFRENPAYRRKPNGTV